MPENPTNVVTVPATKLKEMQEEIRWLRALETAGVDNWDGYDFAREIFEESTV